MPGLSQEAIEEFARAMVMEWKALDQDIIDEIIRSIDNQGSVLAAEGWYTPWLLIDTGVSIN
jgi:hypothetical protein